MRHTRRKERDGLDLARPAPRRRHKTLRQLCALLLGLARQGICFFPILPLMVRLWGVWGIASVQGAADMLVMLLAVPIAVRVLRDIRRREAEQGGEISPV